MIIKNIILYFIQIRHTDDLMICLVAYDWVMYKCFRYELGSCDRATTA